MPETYRVRLADGQSFDMHASAAKIREQYPDSRIVGRIVLDGMGIGSVVPYGGEQPEYANAPTEYDAMTVAALREEIAVRGLDKPPADARKADLIAVLETEQRTPQDDGEKGQPQS